MSSPVLPGTGALLLKLIDDIGDDLIIDPGWGSLAAANRLKISLKNVGTILISHCHIDHVGDLHSLLVILSLATKKPTLIANVTTIEGGLGQPSVLPDYFKKLCQNVIKADSDAKITLGNIQITAFGTAHKENPNITGKSVGYIVSNRIGSQFSLRCYK